MINLESFWGFIQDQANGGTSTSATSSVSNTANTDTSAASIEDGDEESSSSSSSSSTLLSTQPTSNRSENDSLSPSMSELNHRLRLWFPFVFLVLLHFLIAEASKINFIVILSVVVKKLDGTLHEALSGKSTVNHLPFLALLIVFFCSIPVIMISCYFADAVLEGDNHSQQQTAMKFSIAKHFTFRTQTDDIDKISPLTIYDAMWYLIIT